VAEEDVAPPPKATVSRGVQRLPGVRVLLVDDSDVNLEVGKAILDSEGAKVQTACNGREAVQLVLADRGAYDIVLMDLQMPVLDGHDAFARIAAVLGAARPVVVALTAGSLTDVSGEVRSEGMDGLMHKPFDVDELVHWIRRHVGLSDTPAPAKAVSAAAPWPEAPGIETAVARRLMGGNRRLFETALQIFARQYDDIDALLAGKDLNEAARLMHRLKGGAGTIGARTLSDLALRAETACKAGGEDWASALRSVCDEFRQLRDHIRASVAIGEPLAAA
jgi:CheY-like chemotaxis protein/HPt (histidine-containing phosphotransfer) domain-containing protein